jgi:hypothetical protein
MAKQKEAHLYYGLVLPDLIHPNMQHIWGGIFSLLVLTGPQSLQLMPIDSGG